MTVKRLIIFLVRKRLGLKKNEKFVFMNQSSSAFYYFTDDVVMKRHISGKVTKSNVSLNWLLSDECKISKFRM